MTERRRVLVTNDDGIHAAGLRWLARVAVTAGFEVVVAAPDYEASGSSAALTAIYRDRRLAVTPAEFTLPAPPASSSLAGARDDAPGAGPSDTDLPLEAYSVQASPGYVVMLAVIGTFGRKPDLVLSGINRGANTGHAVLHSGTVGAALTAANHGIPAMAVSLDTLPSDDSGASLAEYFSGVESDNLHWAAASEVAHRLLSTVDKLGRETVLNVNVPNRPFDALLGMKQATLAPFGHVQMAVAETGEGYVRTTVERSTLRHHPDTDVALLSLGYATATVISTVREVSAPVDLAGVLPGGRTGHDRAVSDHTDGGPALDHQVGLVTGTN